jgi:hypothetical protein
MACALSTRRRVSTVTDSGRENTRETVAADTLRIKRWMAAWFLRIEIRHRVGGFVLGLLADLPRKTCWSIADHPGHRMRPPTAQPY